MFPFLRMGPLLGYSNPLGLSDAQKENIDQIMDLSQSVMRPHLRRIDFGRKAILALVRHESFDEEAARSIASGLTNDITELMVEHEHLEAMISAELRREQQEHAERLLKELDELLGTADVGIGAELYLMNARICDALSLSNTQKLQLEIILESERTSLRPILYAGCKDKGKWCLPAFSGYFHEEVSRVEARARALKMAELLVSTGRGMARLYGLLDEEQKMKFVSLNDELESYIRYSILPLRSSPLVSTTALSSPAPTRLSDRDAASSGCNKSLVSLA